MSEASGPKGPGFALRGWVSECAYPGGDGPGCHAALVPMLARLDQRIPAGGCRRFEPNQDEFRGIVFKDGDELQIAGRKGVG